jgi:hypothetical protein
MGEMLFMAEIATLYEALPNLLNRLKHACAGPRA